MWTRILFYIIAFVFIVITLLFFNNTYRQMRSFAELTERHTNVHGQFQQLARQLSNAAVISPAFNKESGSYHKVFYTDSAEIQNTFNELAVTVKDSVNIRIVNALSGLIKQELSWILESNVPDSIFSHRAAAHTEKFTKIMHLISQGVDRTNYLIQFRREQLNIQMLKLRRLTLAIALVGGALLIYTTLNFFVQKAKRSRTQQELKTVFNRISDSVISLDENWRYTFLNDAALADHPQGLKDTLGKIIWDVHPGLRGTLFWDKYHEARLTGQATELISYFEPLEKWFSVKVYPSGDGVTVFYRDISKERKIEQDLLQSAKEIADYKFALDQASIVAITDQRGSIKYVNDNFCRISKYSRFELLGRDHRMINSGFHSKEFIKNLWQTIANGKIWKGELKNKAKDGSIYWVDTTIIPFLDERGKPYQYVAIRADITLRKQAEEKLIASEKIYKTIASSIPGAIICLIDHDYRYLLIEGDMIDQIGYSKSALLGKRANEVLPPAVFAEVKNELESAFAGNVVTTETFRNGYDIINRFVPLKDDEGRVYAILTASIDVTELKNAQRDIVELNKNLEEKISHRTRELDRTNAELEAFSYSVSHDLRAPLRGIIGFAAILQEEYADKLDSEAKRITRIITASAAKMGTLIDDLLAFSRLGKRELMKTTVNFNVMVADIINELTLSTQPNPIQWKIGDLPPARCDPNMIRQVWVNFLSNAIKYSSQKETPCIEIGFLKQPGAIAYFIRDNGVGFDPQYSSKLFKVFQRLHDTDQFEGTGVGLALVERIISRHGGSVWAEGKENEGACFYFSIPS